MANAIGKTTQTLQNTAIKHKSLSRTCSDLKTKQNYLSRAQNGSPLMTTDMGMIQFCKISEPDSTTGYTLDDNARALITMCKHFFLLTKLIHQMPFLYKYYVNFIERCQLTDGKFINWCRSNIMLLNQETVKMKI
jgi:hypothetical protein